MINYRPLLAACLLVLSACSTSYKAVGTFDDYNEVLIGTVIHNLATGGGTFSMRGEVSGFECHGTAILESIGYGGRMHAKCSDGRTLTGDWWITSTTTGYGRGQDNRGAGFAFTFGHSEQEAIALIEREMPIAQSKPDLPTYDPKQTRIEKGFSTGTGFFIADGGYILTNYHVVDGVDEIIVHTNDEREFAAAVIAKDPANDIAIIKISESYPRIPLVRVGKLRKASEVMTIGYPLIAIQGQKQKATFGRVNSLSGAGDDVRFLQIDVPVQPGNSGGPLFDKDGNIVGIVTATLDDVDTFKETGALPQNVNYAIKSDYAFPLIESAGIDLPDDGANRAKSFEDIIPEVENSVVLVITK